jgi:phage shock protein PspC (stress-responsive transcriptional regulator)
METNNIPPHDDARDSSSAGNRTGQRTLRRPSQDRLLAGVGAGVADYLGTDVTATRVGLVAVAVLSHVAIPAYAAAWALIPEEGKSRSRAAEFLDSVASRADSMVSRVRQVLSTSWRIDATQVQKIKSIFPNGRVAFARPDVLTAR